MSSPFSLLPEQASTFAVGVDNIYFFLVAVSVFFTALIAALLIFFAVKYRRRPGVSSQPVGEDPLLETLWLAIPFVIVMVMFVWGAVLYAQWAKPPQDSMTVYAVGKQWMWKFQHPTGPREINELHVPVGVPVKLLMTSEDVIHSLYVPAFRVKTDVVPGRYSTVWFEATQTGVFHLFCAEFCGSYHSQMTGRVVVQSPSDYENWLVRGGTGGTASLASDGEQLFRSLGCATCHVPDSEARAPKLAGLFGKSVALNSGRRVKADETYLRESILLPSAKVVQGYETLMPSYQGQVNEEQLVQLVSYLKSLQEAP